MDYLETLQEKKNDSSWSWLATGAAEDVGCVSSQELCWLREEVIYLRGPGSGAVPAFSRRSPVYRKLSNLLSSVLVPMSEGATG